MVAEKEIVRIDEVIRKHARNKCYLPTFVHLAYCYLAVGDPQKAKAALQAHLVEAGRQANYPDVTDAYVGFLLASLMASPKGTKKEERIVSAMRMMDQCQTIVPIAYYTVVERMINNSEKGIAKHLMSFDDELRMSFVGLARRLLNEQKVKKVRYGDYLYLEGTVIDENGTPKAYQRFIGVRPKEESISEGKNPPPKVKIQEKEKTEAPKEMGCCGTPSQITYERQATEEPPRLSIDRRLDILGIGGLP